MPEPRKYRRNVLQRREVAWNLTVAVVSLYALVRATTDIVLGLQEPLYVVVADIVTAVVFVVDPMLHWLRARDRGAEAERAYRHSWFPLDLVVAIPWMVLAPGSPLQLLVGLKLVRVVRFANTWRRQVLRGANVVRFVSFMYYLILVIHVTACGWIWVRGVPRGLDAQAAYLKAAYWSVTTLATVGYGDITPVTDAEIEYAIVVMIVGFFTFGYLIGNIAGMLNTADPLKTRHMREVECVIAFMQYHGIPSELQHRILDYYGYMWQRRIGVEEGSILDSLPWGLRTEVSLYMKRDVIERVPMFREAGEELIRELATSIRPIVVTPGEHVFRVGDPARNMFFISRGSLEILDGRGEVIATLTDGDFFGEMALLARRRRNASVRAMDYSDLYVLDGTVFTHILDAHPEFKEHMERIAAARQSVGPTA